MMPDKVRTTKQTNKTARRRRDAQRAVSVQTFDPSTMKRTAAGPRLMRSSDILGLQHAAGNRTIQRLLKVQASARTVQAATQVSRKPELRKASLMQAKPARVPHWNQLPDYARGHLEGKLDQPSFDALADDLRLTVLNLYVKLQPLGFWGFVGPLELEAGSPGQFNFVCADTQGLWNILRGRNDFELEGDASKDWQAREKQSSGALHIKRFGRITQAHIDQVGYYHTGNILRTIVLGLRHLWNYHSYKDVYGIRDVLLKQGWDPVVLKGTGTTTEQGLSE